MSNPWRALRTALRLLPVVAALAVAVSGSGVRPATLTLTELETAEGYDVGAGVVWVLVLGEDEAHDTDAIQLLGIDARTGAAAGIGFPRDSWVDLEDGRMGKINQAYKEGGAELAGSVVRDLVGIPADYVLVTAGEGFVAMVDALGGVTVDSPLAFPTDDGRLRIHRGPNVLTGEEALSFAQSRRAFPGPGDLVRSSNHQALLLGLLVQLQRQDDDRGFLEATALAGLDGLETDASPADLYRLLNTLTGVDPAKVQGCVLGGTEDVDAFGNQIIRPDRRLAQRLGRESVDDATFESGCTPD